MGDRIQWMAVLILLCLTSIFLLPSQSAASFPTYLLALVMLFSLVKWWDVWRLWEFRWMFILLVWLTASTLWSDPVDARNLLTVSSRSLLVFFFVVAVAECQLRGEMQRWMASLFVLVGAATMLVAVVNFHLTNPADGRLNGLGQLDTHVIAALIHGVVLIFAMRLYADRTEMYWRFLACAAVALAAYCIFMSDSRTAWVSGALGALTFLLSQRIRVPQQLILTMALVAVIGAAMFLVLVMNEDIRQAALPRGDSFRLAIWAETLERISASPFIGLGIGTTDDMVLNDLTFPHPHNLYLALVYQGGLVALTLFVLFLWACIATLLRRYEHQDAKTALSILALSLSAFLLDGHELVDKVGESWVLIWLPAGMAMGLRWSSTYASRD
jgi:O-antigen ligase